MMARRRRRRPKDAHWDEPAKQSPLLPSDRHLEDLDYPVGIDLILILGVVAVIIGLGLVAVR